MSNTTACVLHPSISFNMAPGPSSVLNNVSCLGGCGLGTPQDSCHRQLRRTRCHTRRQRNKRRLNSPDFRHQEGIASVDWEGMPRLPLCLVALARGRSFGGLLRLDDTRLGCNGFRGLSARALGYAGIAEARLASNGPLSVWGHATDGRSVRLCCLISAVVGGWLIRVLTRAWGRVWLAARASDVLQTQHTPRAQSARTCTLPSYRTS